MAPGLYQYASEPSSQPSNITTKKAKKTKGGLPPLNIHADPRVFRGSTVRMFQEKGIDGLDRSSSKQQHARGGEEQQAERGSGEEGRSGDGVFHPPPSSSSQPLLFKVTKAVSDEVDVRSFLVAPSEGVDTRERETQVDKFLPREQVLPFVPRKTGIDQATQVEDPAELFDFDEEVKPLVRIIVSKTIEQALEELQQEHEIVELRKRLRSFKEEKKEEGQKVTSQEREAAERRKVHLKALKTHKQMKRQQQELARKIACRQCLQEWMPPIRSSILKEAERREGGSKLEQEVKATFFPQLMQEVTSFVQTKQQVHAFLKEKVLTSVLDRLIASFLSVKEEEEESKEGSEEAPPSPLQLRKGKLRFFLKPEVTGLAEDLIVGPLTIEDGDTIASLDERIQAWLADQAISLPAFQEEDEASTNEERRRSLTKGILERVVGSSVKSDDQVLGLQLPESGKIQVML